MPAVPPAQLAQAVALRRMLLDAELRVARAVGRAADAGALEAERRALDVFPHDALATRTGPGRLDHGPPCRTSPARAFERESAAVARRIEELRAELRSHGRARRTSR